jgi:hypothetical protein
MLIGPIFSDATPQYNIMGVNKGKIAKESMGPGENTGCNVMSKSTNGIRAAVDCRPWQEMRGAIL